MSATGRSTSAAGRSTQRQQKRKAAPREHEGQGRPEGERKGVDKVAVQEFLKMIQRDDRLGPDFFNNDEKGEWEQWLAAIPESASEAPEAADLLPPKMPRKCLPARTDQSTVGASSSQQELITYRNDGGRQFSKADRSRQYQHTKEIVLADVLHTRGSPVADPSCHRWMKVLT